MQKQVNKFRRRLNWLCVGLLTGLLGIFFLRGPLTQAAVTAGLQRIGAGDIKLDVIRSTPWLVQLQNLAFKIKTQSYAAERVTMERAHWWLPTLGTVRLEGIRVPLTIDGSDTNPFAWASYAGEPSASGGSITVPMEKLSVDGQVIVRTTGHEQALELKFAAQPAGKDTWTGTLQATGPGLSFNAEASYVLTGKRMSFHSTTLSLELKPWQDIIQRLAVMPMGPWTIDGRITGNINGTFAENKLAMDGWFRLEQGQLKNSDGGLSADGIEGNVQFIDLAHFQSSPGTLRVRELRTGKLVANELDAELTFLTSEHLAVNRLTVKIFGGSISAEPFKLALEKQELEAVVLADDLDVEKIMAMSKDLPAKASGRVDGRLPVRIDEHGLRLGTGWLQLKQGVYAEMQLTADGLLTGGMSTKSPSYAVMKRVESGLLRLKLGALRLDVRPPDAQRGQTARLHMEGDPVDPSVKAPVILDLNVNGPLEQLLNFGLKDNVSFGAGK